MNLPLFHPDLTPEFRTLGVAIARTGASSELANAAAVYRSEAYWRINVIGPLHIAPDVQYIRHPQFDTGRDGMLVAGIRAEVTF